jgi:hypothetical protein
MVKSSALLVLCFIGSCSFFSKGVYAKDVEDFEHLREILFQQIAESFSGIERGPRLSLFPASMENENETKLLAVIDQVDAQLESFQPGLLVRGNGQLVPVFVSTSEMGQAVRVYSLEKLRITFDKALSDGIDDFQIEMWKDTLNFGGATAEFSTGMSWDLSSDGSALDFTSRAPKHTLMAIKHFSSIPSVEAMLLGPIPNPLLLGDELPDQGRIDFARLGIVNPSLFQERLPKVDPLFEIQNSATALSGKFYLESNGKVVFSFDMFRIEVSNPDAVMGYLETPVRIWIEGKFYGRYPEKAAVVAIQRRYEFSAELVEENRQYFVVSPDGIRFELHEATAIPDLVPGRVFNFMMVGGMEGTEAANTSLVETLYEIPELKVETETSDGSKVRIAVYGPLAGKNWLRVRLERLMGPNYHTVLVGEGTSDDGKKFSLNLLPFNRYDDEPPRKGELVLGNKSSIVIRNGSGEIEVSAELEPVPAFREGLTFRMACTTVIAKLGENFDGDDLILEF